ncbi:acetate--CoA ligase family protein [Roseovarius sp. LXJ103]|uniref:acetate--CoA ligase family protein n=1 Tax=Roseovarius carneus TaxID=2853164 RepID=UPI000D609068|nr:acetate--CoA ligase family protein [Roseovarius carneus]MBZ8118940.1 acetate--CoA ligase family protein [Roseovarius carneus]PWE35405.1 CoA-binding protein [Pelagicola sp. LXJ1103]
MTHRLDELLRPRSVGIVGASDKPGSNGAAMLAMCALDGFDGAVYPVNPRLSEIDGAQCYPDIAALPEVPDHVVIGVASRFVEGILEQAIALGVRSASIFASLYVEGDPELPARVAAKARGAGMALCGANCMGFYVPSIGLRVASMPSPVGIAPGGIAWIAQSGSTFGALAHNDRRLGFTLCVSTGMELVTGVADYMDWALSQPETRVIGLFLESVRDPAAFVAALKRAQILDVPVVALKVGRTEKAAQMAVSHTGAIAGNDAAYEAVFARYGVARVQDMDEMAAALALFDSPRAPAAGGLGVVSDSGGECEMIIDLAEATGVDFPELSPETAALIEAQLEPGLHAQNPLDAFGTMTDLVSRYAAMNAALVEDAGVAMGFFMSDPRDGYGYAEQYTDALIAAAGRTEKPLAMVTNYSMTDERHLALRLKAAGVPLLRGTRNALLAARHVMAYRDFQALGPDAARAADPGPWAERLRMVGRLAEGEGLEMLRDFGIASPKVVHVSEASGVTGALAEMRFPVVLKTAEDHAHKSDVGGVILGVADVAQAEAAYAEMAARLGPRALFMEMAPKGTELSLGALWDENFGPLVIISAGGILIELLQDRVAALAPFGPDEALRLLRRLKVHALLRGVRGMPPADEAAIAEQIARFSQMIAGLGEACAEMDINPMICGPEGALAVDCLAVGRGS